MKHVVECFLAIALGLAVAGCSKDVGHKGVQLWENGPYWAETNIGAENPWDFGYYFWWGDTIGYKRVNDAWVASDGSSSGFSFKKDNSPAVDKNESDMRKEGWITADGVLAPEHDATHEHWGGNWRMPTKQDLDDVCNRCDWTWTTTNGVNGYVVRGRGVYASVCIFLPCAGYGDGTSLSYVGWYGNYWSSVPDSSYKVGAWGLDFSSSGHNTYYYSYRYYGRPVRPVQDAPQGMGYSGRKKSQEHKGVQLWEGGPYWAETNIGAEKPWEFGYHFWWGGKVGYKYVKDRDAWETSDGSSYSSLFVKDNVPTYDKSEATMREDGWITADGALAPRHDAAHVHWGGEWRMPTIDDFYDLNDKCDWEWTTLNGVDGYVVHGRGVYASASIFLPCAGSGWRTVPMGAGSSGAYWSSVPSPDRNSTAWSLGFSPYSIWADGSERDCGRSVRPVQGGVKIRREKVEAWLRKTRPDPVKFINKRPVPDKLDKELENPR